MAKRVIWGVAILIIGYFIYVAYKSYDANRAMTSGDVSSNDPFSTRSRDGATSINPDTRNPSNQPIIYPAPNQPGGSVATSDTSTPNGQVSQPGASGVASPSTPPPSDSISPNPTNGMVFAGSGRYQLYRQGNITWRLDTNTGQSCIIFATDEEWKKPRVLKAGCGKT